MQDTRLCTKRIALLAVAVALAAGSVRADQSATSERESQLLAVLQSDAPAKEKAITCKRLAVYGTKESVPALAALLSDEQLASWARIALEAIPDPAVDEAFRGALSDLEGRLLVGTINSIGVRRDPKAVDGLAVCLQNPQSPVAAAAADALGRIGNASARQTLEGSLAGAPVAVRSAIAEGCILCAERLLAEGKADQAAQLYDKIRLADVPQQRILEATRGAILSRNSKGIPLLLEQLQAEDKALFALGLRTSRELPGRDVTKALAAQMEKTTPGRQALLITAIAQREDDAVLPQVLAAAKQGPDGVRIVAIEALQRAGDVTCVPALLLIASSEDVALAQAAKQALEGLRGSGVDDELASRLSQADETSRLVLIQLVGLRRIDAISALLEAADDPNMEIRTAALISLGATVGPSDLSVLISRVVAPSNAEEAEAALTALRAACVRMPDRDACAKQLVAAMSKAPLSAQTALLEALGSVGGVVALRSVATAAKDERVELQDTASRLLGTWMTADAAPVLIDLAKTAPEDKYRTRALRGYIRIARQFSFPGEKRAEMCRQALRSAKRDAERILVLQVLERYPSIEMLELAVEAAQAPSLKDEATKVSLTIAQKIGGKSADLQKLLAQIDQEPVELEIIKAEYGVGKQVKDVTEMLRKRVGSLPLVTLPSTNYNNSFGGDPAPGIRKQLKVTYRLNGKEGKASFAENAMIVFPVPEDGG